MGAKALALLLVFIAPIQAVMLATGALILADAMTGIWAAIKEGQNLTSFKFKRTIAKSFAYLGAILVGHIVETHMLSEAVPIVKTITGLIAITEAKSIFENIKRASGVDFWSMILDKLQGANIKIPPDLPK